MVKQHKVDAVSDVKERFERAELVLLAKYRGLKAGELTDLRRRIRATESEFKVEKNSLVKRAAAEAGVSGLDEMLLGPVALTFVYGDPVGAAKAVTGYAKEQPILEVVGGYMSGGVLSAAQIKELANILPREQLLAKLMGSIQSPASGLVRVMNGPVAALARALAAVAGKGEAA